MTNLSKISINIIDKFHNVCYTENKLDNKTNNLTNKTKIIKTKGAKMPNNIQEKISTKTEMQSDAFQLFGGTELAESEYVNTNEVGRADYSMERQPLFAYNDKMAA